jgi:hypothetical protein
MSATKIPMLQSTGIPDTNPISMSTKPTMIIASPSWALLRYGPTREKCSETLLPLEHGNREKRLASADDGRRVD